MDGSNDVLQGKVRMPKNSGATTPEGTKLTGFFDEGTFKE